MEQQRKELLEERGEISREIKALAATIGDERAEFDENDQAKWDKLNSRFDSIDAEVRRLDQIARADDVARRSATPANGPRPTTVDNGSDVAETRGASDGREVTDRDQALAFQAWARVNAGLEVREDHRAALDLCGVRDGSRDFEFRLGADANRSRVEKRAQSSILGSAGGYLVPEGFIPRVEVALAAFGGVRRNAEVIRTSSGNDLPWPTCDDTSNTGELVGENTAVTEQDVTIGIKVLRAYKFSSKMIRFPVELLEDSEIDLVGFLADRLGERIGRITNTEFTNGSGASRPEGIVTAAPTGVTAAGATTFTSGELIDLIHSVDPAYRQFGANVGWMMSDGVLSMVRQLTDGDGRYLWSPDVAGMSPDGGRLLGYPIHVNQDMVAVPASTEKSVLFGDFAAYKVREVRGIRFRRLVERYADLDQEAVLGFLRTDGMLLDAGTGPIKALLH